MCHAEGRFRGAVQVRLNTGPGDTPAPQRVSTDGGDTPSGARAAIRIRAAEPEDGEAIAGVWNEPEAVAGTMQLPYRSVEHRRQRLAQLQPDSHTLVAEVEGRVVGLATLTQASQARRRHTGYVGMAVHDDFHGQGVGTALLEALMDLADNWLALKRVELQVYTDNAAAIRLYEKFGFVIEGTSKDYAFGSGRYLDAHHMARVREW